MENSDVDRQILNKTKLEHSEHGYLQRRSAMIFIGLKF